MKTLSKYTKLYVEKTKYTFLWNYAKMVIFLIEFLHKDLFHRSKPSMYYIKYYLVYYILKKWEFLIGISNPRILFLTAIGMLKW